MATMQDHEMAAPAARSAPSAANEMTAATAMQARDMAAPAASNAPRAAKTFGGPCYDLT